MPRRGVVVMVVVPVMMVMMAVMVLVFLVTVDSHLHVGARDSAGLGRHRSDLHPGQAQAVHRV